jgi:hypothetical protein
MSPAHRASYESDAEAEAQPMLPEQGRDDSTFGEGPVKAQTVMKRLRQVPIDMHDDGRGGR